MSITIAAGALVAAEARIEGDVTIGEETVVHPTAVILALDGPIDIGKRNVIEEKVVHVCVCEATSTRRLLFTVCVCARGCCTGCDY